MPVFPRLIVWGISRFSRCLAYAALNRKAAEAEVHHTNVAYMHLPVNSLQRSSPLEHDSGPPEVLGPTPNISPICVHPAAHRVQALSPRSPAWSVFHCVSCRKGGLFCSRRVSGLVDDACPACGRRVTCTWTVVTITRLIGLVCSSLRFGRPSVLILHVKIKLPTL